MSKKNKPIRVKLIANPGAGKVSDSANNLKLVAGYLKKNGLKVDVAFARPKEEAIPIARRAIKDGYKIVIAMGGDGTIEAVMRGLVGSKVRLGIVPVGTENNIAKSLGISGDLKEACALIASDNTLKLDVGQVTTSKGKKFVFFEMATVGLSAAIYPDAVKVVGGKLSRIKDAALTLIHQETNPSVFLTINDESKIEVETMLVTIANTPISGAKNMVAPEASMEDGLLDIAVYPGFSKAELMNYFFKSSDEGVIPDGRIQRYRANKIKVKTSPKMDIAAEGIIIGKGSAWIKVIPAGLRVIAPKIGKGAEKTPKQTTKKLPSPVSPVS